MNRLFGLALCAFIAFSSPTRAQGVQTGTITGIVQSPDGLSLPGVTVTATSPSLQGQRRAVTDVNGVYFIRALPPGAYSITFEVANFQTANANDVVLELGGVAEANQTLMVAARTETVNVSAEIPSALATTTVSQAFTKQQVDALPVGRRPQDIAELAPGLTNNTPNTSQVTIAGATAFDNVFMLNGVDINDNLFGSPNNLYTEDAIQETNVLTGGISAEWGRFSGGMVNVITKSGGNNFSGSFRENFNNPKWIEETPRERSNNVQHQDVLGKVHEGTFGGPIARDRLWFFSAGRYQRDPTPGTFVQTGGSYTRVDTIKRGEIKLTGTFAPNQTLSGDFTTNSTVQRDRPSSTRPHRWILQYSSPPRSRTSCSSPPTTASSAANYSARCSTRRRHGRQPLVGPEPKSPHRRSAREGSWRVCLRTCTTPLRFSARWIRKSGTTNSSPAAFRTPGRRRESARMTSKAAGSSIGVRVSEEIRRVRRTTSFKPTI